MFNPTRDQVRQFFFDAWRKHREGLPLAGLDPTAIDIMLSHPEYHAILDDPDANRERDWTPESGTTNPFLHLSMHLAIEEQVSIDQPPGIRDAVDAATRRLGDPHAARHAVIECLGEMMWRAQRGGGTPDALAYLACVRRAGRK